MKIVAFNLKGFELSEKNVARIKSVADAEVVQVSDSESLGRELADADVLITNNHAFSRDLLDSAKKLRYVHSLAAGVEKIIPALPEKVLLANARGVHGINIAEHVLGFMLMHEHRLDAALRAQMKKEWIMKELSPLGGRGPGEIYGRTVAVFGLGNIGKRIAEVCSRMGMKVLGVRSRASEKPDFVDAVFSSGNCEKALAAADYVVVAMPGTSATNRFFGREKFGMMKPSAFFINIGRGSIVREDELEEALRKGGIAGAGLDVFETEPLPESSGLWEMDNVIITPHSAGFTPHYMDRFTEIFCNNLRAFLEGKPLPSLVDRRKGY